MKLIPSLKPVDQLEAWKFLHSYCESKPKDEPDTDDTIDDYADKLRDVSNPNLIRLLRGDEKKESIDE